VERASRKSISGNALSIISSLKFRMILEVHLRRLAYAARHLQLDQTVQLNGVFHWQFFSDWLNETVNDQ